MPEEVNVRSRNVCKMSLLCRKIDGGAQQITSEEYLNLHKPFFFYGDGYGAIPVKVRTKTIPPIMPSDISANDADKKQKNGYEAFSNICINYCPLTLT